MYFNYKKSFSVVLMALVDHKYCFSAIDVGAYGSNSDGGIFKACPLGKKLVNGTLDIPEDKALPGTTEPMPLVMIGDEAFPLRTNLMRPVPGRGLSKEDRIFNYRLSRARRIVENAFGILANRWRMYHRKIPLDPNNVDSVVRASCILHNMMQTDSHPQGAPACPPIEQGGDITDGILRDLDDNGGRSGADAMDIRDRFKEYFSSPQGSVSWQDQCCFGHCEE
ncbi:uncharacterized protein LOC135489494 [Lineus longissimus]|uniref:uncharacterized protein LOC135489494 n=1 Tax=Lineus longissimus TaxID=88925 RepID=UPI00315C77C8